MTVLIAVIVAVVLGAAGLRSVRRRMLDERQSVDDYRRTLSTIRQLSEQSSTSVRLMAPSTERPLEPRVARHPSVRSLAEREEAATAEIAGPAPAGGRSEPARVVHELIAGRALASSSVADRAVPPSARPRFSGWGLLTSVAAVLVLVAAVSVALVAAKPTTTAHSATRAAQHHSAPKTSSSSGSRAQTTPSSIIPTSSSLTAATYILTGSNDEVELTATTGPCWVLATDLPSGTTLWEGTLEAGQSRTFDDTGDMELRLGNAFVVQMTVGGKAVQFPTGYAGVFSATFDAA